MDSVRELVVLTVLARESMSLAQHMDGIAEQLNRLDPNSNIDTKQTRLWAERASFEVGTGFRHLYRQATISLWTTYEIAINDFVQEWLETVGGLAFRTSDQAHKWAIKIPINEAMDWVETKDRYEIAGEIADELRNQLSVNRGSSPEKFMKLLKAVGIEFSFDDKTRDSIRELWAFRNVFVHRGQFADDRFLHDFPGVDYELDDEVVVDTDRFTRFHHAVVDHVASIGDEAERVAREIDSEND
jgi:hypothetical protein